MPCNPPCNDAWNTERDYRSSVLRLLRCIYEGNIEGVNYDYEFLCDPSDGRTIYIRYCNLEDGTPCTPPAEAFELDGTPYAGSISALVPCAGDSGAIFEYVICDNGTTKIAQVCADGCSITSIDYILLDRSASTTPANFALVTFGPCTTQDEPQVLCDDDGAGTFTPFLRRYVIDHLGAVTIVDTLLDGTSVYVPSGTVTECSLAGGGLAVELLCDNNGINSVTPFLRQIDSSGVVTDTTLDGTTPYVTTGTVEKCHGYEINVAALCDDDDGTVFLRHYISDQEGLPLGSFDTDLDGAAYVLVGTAIACNQPNDVIKILCDSANGTKFLRRYVINNDGTVEITDTTLDGTTGYVLSGSAAACSESNDVVEILCDNNDGTKFLRRYTVDSVGTVTTTDTTLDGTTPYVVVGSAVVCDGAEDFQVLCDVDTYGDQIAQFIRILYTDGTFDDFEMDGTTPYSPTGTVEECCCEAQTENIAPSIASTTTSGSTTAGSWEVTIMNTGGAAGTIDGDSFPAGATFNAKGYYDEVNRQMKRLASISYDATGTTFIIIQIP